MEALEHLKPSLAPVVEAVGASAQAPELNTRFHQLEREITELKMVIDDQRALILSLDARVKTLEGGAKPDQVAVAKPSAPAPAKPASKNEDDGVDIFGNNAKDEEAEKIKQDCVAAYDAEKSTKPALIAKSSFVLIVQHWDVKNDLAAVEEKIRTVQCDGLQWGVSKVVPLGFGDRKLQISCVVEDEKVSVRWLREKMQEFKFRSLYIDDFKREWVPQLNLDATLQV